MTNRGVFNRAINLPQKVKGYYFNATTPAALSLCCGCNGFIKFYFLSSVFEIIRSIPCWTNNSVSGTLGFPFLLSGHDTPHDLH